MRFPQFTTTASNLQTLMQMPQRVQVSSSITWTSRFAPLMALLVQLRRQTMQPLQSSGTIE
jgi:hypothetical protein